MATILLTCTLFLCLCALCKATDVPLSPKGYHSGGEMEKVENVGGGGGWDKRHFNGRPDFYNFLMEEQRRGGGHHQAGDYMAYLDGGDKKSAEKKNREEYWDFLGAGGMKRTVMRKKRSSGNPGEMELKTAGAAAVADRRSHGGVESWDDFVLGKKSDHDMSFDDFLLGKKRNDRLSDYDYAEFVLGKRP